MIYLDNSATTRQYDLVTDRMVQYMREDFGNPSSLYAMGITAEKVIKQARKQVITSMGQDSGELYFTSGGTESDNMAIFSTAEKKKRQGRRIITSKVEHPAVLEACRKLENQGFEVIYVGVDTQGLIDMGKLKEAVNEQTILISIMHVNNETGAIMPVDEIAQVKGKAILHTDCVQSFCKLPLPKKADLASISGHKIHGPKGIGALYIKKGTVLPPFIVGGGQENHMRSGTENVPAIAGLGQAVQIGTESIKQRMEQISKVRRCLLDGIQTEISDIKINSPIDGCPSVLNISFLGTRGEVLLHTLEQDGICVSTGSACSSNKKGQSHVLKAMGLKDKEIEGAIRFSFSEFNTEAQMEEVADRLKKAVAKFRKLGSFR